MSLVIALESSCIARHKTEIALSGPQLRAESFSTVNFCGSRELLDYDCTARLCSIVDNVFIALALIYVVTENPRTSCLRAFSVLEEEVGVPILVARVIPSGIECLDKKSQAVTFL